MSLDEFNANCRALGIPELNEGFLAWRLNLEERINDDMVNSGFREEIGKVCSNGFSNLDFDGLFLPFIVKQKSDIANEDLYISSLFSVIHSYLTKMESQQNIVGKSTIDSIDKNIKLIEGAFTDCEKGNINDAQDKIKSVIQKYYDKPFFVSTISDNYAFNGLKNYDSPHNFFRGRRKKADSKIELRREMFHVPINLAETIGTERYNIPCRPCLYLSTTSYGCYLELGKPDADQFYCSAYKVPENLRVFNLCITRLFLLGQAFHIDNNLFDNPHFESKQNFLELLELFPLVIACSFRLDDKDKTDDEESKIKSEYIIPQILMQVLKKDGINGIAYNSMHINHERCFLTSVNLAMLAECTETITKDENQYDKTMATEIELTKPVLMDKALSTNPHYSQEEYISFVNKHCTGCNSVVEIIDKDNNLKTPFYQNTEFSKFDEYLLRQPFDNI